MANEVEIKYKLNATEFDADSKKIESAIGSINAVQVSSTEDLRENIAIQKRVLKDLEKQYKELNATIKDTAPGAGQQELKRQLDDIRQELDGEKEALIQLTSAQEQFEHSQRSLHTKIAETRNELSKMTEGTEACMTKVSELGALQDQYGDIPQQGRVFVDDNKNIKAVTEGIQLLNDAMATATGVASLFGASQENLERIQTKLQAVMAIAVSTQQLATALNKDSYFSLVILAKAKTILAVAHVKLAAALGVSTLAAKAFMIAITGGAIIAVYAVIALIEMLAKKHQAAAEKAEVDKKAQQDFFSAVAEATSTPVTAFKKLQSEWSKLSSEAEKLKWLKDNKEAFDKLGLSINDVTSAENALVTNASAVVESFRQKAIAAALADLAKDDYKKVVELQMQKDDRAANPTKEDRSYASDKTGEWFNEATKGKNASSRGALQNQYETKRAEYVQESINAANANTDAEIAKIISQADKRINAAQYLIGQSNKSLSDVGVEVVDNSKTKSDADAAAKQAAADAQKRQEDKASARAAAQKQYLSQLDSEAAQLADLEFKTRQQEIDTMGETSAQKLAQLALNRDKELAAIRDFKQKELAEQQSVESNEYVAQNGTNEGFVPSTRSFDQLSQEYQNFANGWAVAVQKRFNDETTKLADQTLQDYSTYAADYLAQAEAFESNLANLKSSGASAETVDSVSSIQDELLASMQAQGDGISQEFIAFCDTIVGQSLDELVTTMSMMEVFMESAQMVGDQSSVTDYQTQISALKQRILELSKQQKGDKDKDKKDDKKKDDDPSKKWKKTVGVMEDVKTLTANIGKNFGGLSEQTSQIFDGAVDIASGVTEMIGGIESLATGSGEAISATSEATSKSMSTAEKASVILMILSAAVKIITAIANIFANLFSNDKLYEQMIQDRQKEIDKLKDGYKELTIAVDKSYAAEKASLLSQQEANLKRQKMLIQQQRQLEDDKKKTDDEKLEKYDDSLKELNKQLDEFKDKQIEALTGTSISSAIDAFASSIADSWSSKADAVRNGVRDMVKTAISEMMKQRLSPEVAAFQSFLATAMTDGILTQAEEDVLDTLENNIYKKADSVDKRFDKYFDESEEDESTLSGQIRGSVATEESVAELGGIFRGQWDTAKKIESGIVEAHKTLIESALIQREIADNTRRSADNSDIVIDKLNSIDKKTIKPTQNDNNTTSTRG